MIKQEVLINNSSVIQALYDEYAGLLLGYIYEVVKDREIAEEYLVSVFNELPEHINEITRPGLNTYHQLQLLARKVLADYFATIPVCVPTNPEKTYLPSHPNKFLLGMTEEQQLIFCSVHYHGKSICDLAAELNTTETCIKTILKQAFEVIRRMT